MEVTIGEIIENISLENINVEAIVCYADNKIVDIVFNGINDASGYQKLPSELGLDVCKIVNMSNVDYYVESIVDILRNDIINYQSGNRNSILKKKIRDVEMYTYGWE
ncbi:hypothetical protein LMHOCYYV_CDS0134 [Staphylococcus phage PG-2021_4]